MICKAGRTDTGLGYAHELDSILEQVELDGPGHSGVLAMHVQLLECVVKVEVDSPGTDSENEGSFLAGFALRCPGEAFQLAGG